LVLSACANPLNREPGPPPTATPPFARESAAVATAEASGDAKARAGALYERGNAKFDAGKLEDAIADYNQALKLDPRNARAFNNRALAQSALGKTDAALADYGQAIKLDPGYVRAYKNRLPLLEQKGDLRTIAADYNQLAALDADNADEYRYRQGAALRGLGDTAGARKAFDAALARNPEHVDALYERALLNFAERKLPAAIADLDKAIGQSPRAANAHYVRGLAWSAQGDPARALADFDVALKLKPKYPEAQLARASALHAANDDARARAALDGLDQQALDDGLKAAADALRRQLGSRP
jgi:tetratricopeptide (TPR) repeat protein